MTKEFVPYKLALALKELGFDEPCFAIHSINLMTENEDWELRIGGVWKNQELVDSIKAPTFSQEFRWFREKYKLYPEIGLHDREDEKTWRLTISILGYYELAYNQNVGKEPYYKTYEETESACLIKLIEIVKTK